MASSVGENVPPDRGRNLVDIQLEGLSKIYTSPAKAAKRCIDSLSDIPEKRNIPAPAIASLQHTFTRPGYEENNALKYTETDLGPFVVHVRRPDNYSSTLSNSMRMYKLAQIIYNGQVSGVIEMKNIGRDKISVIFKTYQEANSFLSNPLLSSKNLTASIPRYQLTRMGVIHQIPLDWSLEELVLWTECRPESITIVKARRLNRKKRSEGKVSWEPTGSVVLTFLGQLLPTHVYCCNVSTPVSLYTLPSIQCHKCCRFGHIRDQCRSKPRCSRCAGSHDGISCDTPDDKLSCILCSGSHSATNPSCPEHNRQKLIKMTMSEENISYTEASLRFSRSRTSYADITNKALPRKPVFLNHPMQNNPSTTQSIPQSQQLPPLTPLPKTPSSSYKKTIYFERKSRPELGKSYDQQYHTQITSSPSSAFPNGCALSQETSASLSPNDNLAELLSKTLINVLSRFGEIIPNNVLTMIQTIITSLLTTLLKNGELPAMELA